MAKGNGRRKQETVEAQPPHPGAARAKRELVTAVTHARVMQDRTGRAYAAVVRAVGRCRDAGMSTQTISGIIVQTWARGTKSPDEVSKGIAARYIMMDRWQRKLYGKNEHPPVGPVDVAGHGYSSPLEALDSGQATFTGTWKAFKLAIQEPRPRPKPTANPFLATIAMLDSWVVPMESEGKVSRVHPLASANTAASILAAVLTSEPIKELVPEKARVNVLNSLAKAPDLAPETKSGIESLLHPTSPGEK